VAVVPASVVHALARGPIRLSAIELVERQRVDVCAQQHLPPRLRAFQDAHDPGLANTRSHLIELQRSQALGNDIRRAVLLVRQLRVHMQVSPQRDKPLLLFDGKHQVSRRQCTRTVPLSSRGTSSARPPRTNCQYCGHSPG